MSNEQLLRMKNLGLRDYVEVMEEMKNYTKNRSLSSADDILWLVEHYPVFTQGLAGDSKYLINTGDIPVVQSDRGGQITYHGLGQVVIYPLLCLKEKNLAVRDLVSMLETATVKTLANLGIKANGDSERRGVYLEDGRKISSIGLKISRSCTYHGISINCDMDLEPFSRITPCGLEGIKMAQISEFKKISVVEVAEIWRKEFSNLWF